MITKALIGNKVRIARTRQSPRLRQRDVDDLVGVPHGRTAHYENGRAAAPHAYLLKLSSAWNIPIAWFLSTDSDDLPHLDRSGGFSQAGFGWIELRPSLPTGQVDGARPATVEVDSKFVREGAFACRITGDILAPKVLHGDLAVFWSSSVQPLGVACLSTDAVGQQRLVIPAYNSRTGATELHGPGTHEPASGVTEVTGHIVGVVRTLPDGDTFTLTNFDGIRL